MIFGRDRQAINTTFGDWSAAVSYLPQVCYPFGRKQALASETLRVHRTADGAATCSARGVDTARNACIR